MSLALPKQILRSIGAIRLLDNLRYRYMKYKNRLQNKRFKLEHPEIAIPPDYLLYESHNVNYSYYLTKGRQKAEELIKMFQKYTNLNDKNILDWGCGPSRVVRHFPELLPKSHIFGTDYNTDSISWNRKYIDGVRFFENEINPPTHFKDQFFDAIYGLSIFTHLSEENHHNWINELYRISKVGAVLILTTHGENYKVKLTKSDQKKYESDVLVVKGNTLEGHRTYAAYQPPQFMRQLFADKFEVLEHIPGPMDVGYFDQDKWIIKRI
ncbi:class I SAM-dependent methyltransferase [Psychroserpens sp. SPM9]|uniref:class I SAM-dependent methyltransferase n=1 Tax=Psychroserpens sp. SPM9 TaxID=2975598 RepID=UPI0021A59A4B|nr:class I SAM-dependent methyltransferase [Psychroserpens sp. SPM9]MDG5492599.1 class I SAM-dependent methyltransferase [Psychroserpens sp. SPM9]